MQPNVKTYVQNSTMEETISHARSQYKIRPIIIWISLLCFSFVVNSMRIPLQNTLTVLSTGGLLGYTVHALVNTKGKSIVINILLILNLIWLVCLICFVMFNGGHPLNHRALGIYLAVAFIYFCIYRLVRLIRKQTAP